MSIKVAGLTVERMIPDGNGGYTEFNELTHEKQMEQRKHVTELTRLAVSRK